MLDAVEVEYICKRYRAVILIFSNAAGTCLRSHAICETGEWRFFMTGRHKVSGYTEKLTHEIQHHEQKDRGKFGF